MSRIIDEKTFLEWIDDTWEEYDSEWANEDEVSFNINLKGEYMVTLGDVEIYIGKDFKAAKKAYEDCFIGIPEEEEVEYEDEEEEEEEENEYLDTFKTTPDDPEPEDDDSEDIWDVI